MWSLTGPCGIETEILGGMILNTLKKNSLKKINGTLTSSKIKNENKKLAKYGSATWLEYFVYTRNPLSDRFGTDTCLLPYNVPSDDQKYKGNTHDTVQENFTNRTTYGNLMRLDALPWSHLIK